MDSEAVVRNLNYFEVPKSWFPLQLKSVGVFQVISMEIGWDPKSWLFTKAKM